MQAYINYLKNVLGIQQVIKKADNISPQPKQIVVWVENLSRFTQKDQTLLNNMLAATKIPQQSFAIYDLKDKSTELSLPIQFDLVTQPDQSGLQTYSPQVLHENKTLKAEAWAFLQTIITKYKTLS